MATALPLTSWVPASILNAAIPATTPEFRSCSDNTIYHFLFNLSHPSYEEEVMVGPAD